MLKTTSLLVVCLYTHPLSLLGIETDSWGWLGERPPATRISGCGMTSINTALLRQFTKRQDGVQYSEYLGNPKAIRPYEDALDVTVVASGQAQHICGSGWGCRSALLSPCGHRRYRRHRRHFRSIQRKFQAKPSAHAVMFGFAPRAGNPVLHFWLVYTRLHY